MQGGRARIFFGDNGSSIHDKNIRICNREWLIEANGYGRPMRARA